MNYRQVEIRSNERVEFVTVRDDKHNRTHYLILSINESHTLDKSQTDRYINAQIEVNAKYLYGPLSSYIGRIVCKMGGKTISDYGVKISNGDVMVEVNELRGLHIGSFILNRIVIWAKTLEPERKIHQLKLVEQDATDSNNKLRRNNLYRKFGIKLVFNDPLTESSGKSAIDVHVKDLVEFTDREWSNIKVDNWIDGFGELNTEFHRIRDQLRQSRRRLAFYKRKSNRFDAKVGTVIKTLHNIINLPLFFIALLIGYLVAKI